MTFLFDHDVPDDLAYAVRALGSQEGNVDVGSLKVFLAQRRGDSKLRRAEPTRARESCEPSSLNPLRPCVSARDNSPGKSAHPRDDRSSAPVSKLCPRRPAVDLRGRYRGARCLGLRARGANPSETGNPVSWGRQTGPRLHRSTQCAIRPSRREMAESADEFAHRRVPHEAQSAHDPHQSR